MILKHCEFATAMLDFTWPRLWYSSGMNAEIWIFTCIWLLAQHVDNVALTTVKRKYEVLCIYLISSIAVLRRTRGYLIRWQLEWWLEETSMRWIWTHGDRSGEWFLGPYPTRWTLRRHPLRQRKRERVVYHFHFRRFQVELKVVLYNFSV